MSNKQGKMELFGIWIPSKSILVAVFFLLVLVIGGIISGATWVNIETGNSSIIRNTYDGTLKPGPLGPLNRPFVKQPFFEDVISIYTAVSSVRMCSGYDANLVEQQTQALPAGCDAGSPIGITKDGIRLAIDVNIFWTISSQSDKLINLYRNYPNLDYTGRVITPTIREVVRDVIVNRTFDEVFAQRQLLPQLIATDSVNKIAHNPSLEGIIQIDPTSIQVLNIHMPQSIQDQLQAKLNSQILIQTAQNNRNATIVNADAQRQQQILQAQGIAQAQLIQANATRDSILRVIQSIGCTNSSACQQEAGDLYLQLLNYKAICSGTTNCIFLIGQGSNGQPIIYNLPTQSTSTTTTMTTTATITVATTKSP